MFCVGHVIFLSPDELFRTAEQNLTHKHGRELSILTRRSFFSHSLKGTLRRDQMPLTSLLAFGPPILASAMRKLLFAVIQIMKARSYLTDGTSTSRSVLRVTSLGVPWRGSLLSAGIRAESIMMICFRLSIECVPLKASKS